MGLGSRADSKIGPLWYWGSGMIHLDTWRVKET